MVAQADGAARGTRAAALPIAIRGVRKNYGAVAALDRVDLDVRSGEFLTLLGPSGSGKTTTLMMIAGFIRRTRAASPSARRGDPAAAVQAQHRHGVPELRAVSRI